MNNISITLNNEEIYEVHKQLHEYELSSNNEAILHFYKFNNATITIYKTKVLVIQAKNADEIYQDIFHKPYKQIDLDQQEILDTNKIINQNNIATVGSDEVGVGDFFGGIIVVAAYIQPNQIALLKDLGIKDSKQLDDSQILEIYQKLKEIVIYDVMSISPEQYNEQFLIYQNSHIIKAVAHNQALWNLSKKIKRPYFVIIDQFVDRKNYSKYLRLANKTEYTIDIFETKAESKYLAVACASIIARALFLKQMNDLETTLDIALPLGSSNPKIKETANEIINKYGIDVLRNICKNHFITYKEIIKGE